MLQYTNAAVFRCFGDVTFAAQMRISFSCEGCMFVI
jgi:hypothetical protein